MKTVSFEGLTILGISSMIRDLDIFGGNADDLEQMILAESGRIPASAFSHMAIAYGSDLAARVGDIVVFRLKNAGAYADMETMWGGRVALLTGGLYIGVLCERGSTKLITAQFPSGLCYQEHLELQLVAQAGGIGFATGYSPPLAERHGRGTASDVEVLGTLYDERRGLALNTIRASNTIASATLPNDLPPMVVVLGTATDVGKTTVVAALLRELSPRHRCAALKASGTGWYEDSLLHMQSGAFPVLNYTFAGLPTTYYVDPRRYLNAIYWLLGLLRQPDLIPDRYLPPDTRELTPLRPELVMVEHGGDLIWANVPAFLQDPILKGGTKVVLVCSESAVSLMGALDELHRMGIRNSSQVAVFASVPLVNPEGFFKRVETRLESGDLAGVFDVQKPLLVGEKEKRCSYSMHYEDILSCGGLAQAIEKHIGRWLKDWTLGETR